MIKEDEVLGERNGMITMKKIVEQRLKPILKTYFDMIKAEGLNLVIDGV